MKWEFAGILYLSPIASESEETKSRPGMQLEVLFNIYGLSGVNVLPVSFLIQLVV